MNLLDAIGNTPLVALRRLPPAGCGKVFVKMESANPSGSMKDRVAKAMVEGAERSGRLRPGQPIVEYSGGSTGISLALVAAAKKYPLKVVFSDAFSADKRITMESLGANVMELKSDGGRMTASLFNSMVSTADDIAKKEDGWFCDQLRNADGIGGYHSLGDEIWRQSEGKVDAFVQTVGSAQSIIGVGRALRKYEKNIRIIAVEPKESPVLSGGLSGGHKIDGIGIGFIPPLWDPKLVNSIRTVSTEEAKTMARRLAKEEGIFCGTSTGANVVAALEVAKELGPSAVVVTLIIDSGLRYISTHIHQKVDDTSNMSPPCKYFPSPSKLSVRILKSMERDNTSFATLMDSFTLLRSHCPHFHFRYSLPHEVTADTLWDVLQVKGKHANLFVPPIEECDVIEKCPLGFIRTIRIKDGPPSVRERVIVDEANRTLIFIEEAVQSTDGKVCEGSFAAFNRIVEESSTNNSFFEGVYMYEEEATNDQIERRKEVFRSTFEAMLTMGRKATLRNGISKGGEGSVGTGERQ